MIWDALSFNNDNTDIYFDLTCPLNMKTSFIPTHIDLGHLRTVLILLTMEARDV